MPESVFYKNQMTEKHCKTSTNIKQNEACLRIKYKNLNPDAGIDILVKTF